MDEQKVLEGGLQNREKILRDNQPDQLTAITREQKDMIVNVLKAERVINEWPRLKVELTTQISALQRQSVSLLQKLP